MDKIEMDAITNLAKGLQSLKPTLNRIYECAIHLKMHWPI